MCLCGGDDRLTDSREQVGLQVVRDVDRVINGRRAFGRCDGGVGGGEIGLDGFDAVVCRSNRTAIDVAGAESAPG